MDAFYWQVSFVTQQPLLSQVYFQANYFSRADVALPGFSKYFQKASDRELENANEFMKYVNMRGGSVDFIDIPVVTISFTSRFTYVLKRFPLIKSGQVPRLNKASKGF